MKKLDLQGQRFGRLLVLEYAGVDSGNKPLWKCICDCGNFTISLGPNLRRGGAKSCGCLRREVASQRAKQRTGRNNPNYRHGANSGRKESREHCSWSSMLQRCRNPRNSRWLDYGGRGITVCVRWQGKTGFENFLLDMGPRPDGYSLDRIDSSGNYEPKNCKWSSYRDQVKNRRKYLAIANFSEDEFLAEAVRRGYELQTLVPECGMSGC